MMSESSSGGGAATHRQKNPFAAPVDAVLKWNAEGWKISETEAKLVIACGESVERSFSFAPAT